VIGRLDLIAATAGSRGPVFLFGEPGVGKEELARELYARSNRRRANFRKVNCANFVGDLMESEIYGHMKGAFTGASANKNGIVEDVKGGVLFIDEVDKLAIDQQNRLLQFLETGTYRKLGSTRDEKIDVLTVLASNQDPRSAGDARASAPFVSRLKFLFRIAPLRERMTAVDDIARALCARISSNLKYEERILRPDALKWLREQVAAGKFDGQGGNIRGLGNLIEATIIYNSKRREIGRPELIAAAKSEAPRAGAAADAIFHSAAKTVVDGLLPAGHADMDRTLDNFKAEFLREIIIRMGGRNEAAAFVYKKPGEPLKKKQEAFRQHIHGLRQKGLWPWDV
jgi:two-component system repressor protein LuxO